MEEKQKSEDTEDRRDPASVPLPSSSYGAVRGTLERSRVAILLLELARSKDIRHSSTEEEWQSLREKYLAIRSFFQDHLEVPEREEAMTCLSKLWPVYYHLKHRAQQEHKSIYDLLKEDFPNHVPDDFVQYCKSCEEQYAPSGHLQWCPYISADERFVEKRLLELINGRRELPACADIPFEINQSKFPGFFYGFDTSSLPTVLSKGILSYRKMFGKGGNRGDFDTSEPAFPMFVSLSRPISSPVPFAEARGYQTSTIYGNYGPGEYVSDKIAAIIDPDFIVSRSFMAAGAHWGFYQTHLDEYESTVDTIPPDKIIGFICHPHKKEKIIAQLRMHPKRYFLYDLDGNLLWPHEMGKEDVASEFREKFLSKLTK